MKINILFTLLLLVSLNAYSGNDFIIAKDDFVRQFSGGVIPDRIICTKETGEKIVVGVYDNATLVVEMNNEKKKKLILSTVRYSDGIIHATERTPIWDAKRPTQLNLSDVATISIVKMFVTYSNPYFDMNSVKALCKQKNDSLTLQYRSIDRYAVYFNSKNPKDTDTLVIVEDARYHIIFNKRDPIEYGIIKKITNDSIYVLEDVKPHKKMPNREKGKVQGYLIQEISGLRLLKSGGVGYRDVMTDEYDVRTVLIEKNTLQSPSWFSINRITGEIRLYRLWLTEGGFKGVMEKDGRIYWFEG